MQPIDPKERNELAAKGALEERLAFAYSIGNHKPDPFLLKQALNRTARQHLQESQGVSISRLDELFTLAPPPARHGMQTTGKPKVFALLIEFPDHPHTIDPSTINDGLFGSPTTGKPYESLANYYKRASYNLLDLSNGNTLGWYKASKNRSDIKTYENVRMSDKERAIKQEQERDSLIKEALLHFKAQGHDFAQYDNDNDGFIDYFMVFWTGPDTGWATFWWGYTPGGGFLDSSFKLDGKSLKKYTWQWESDPVGTAFSPVVVIHETGHALGLPDLYDYKVDVGPKGGVGGADMMDGNWLDHNCFSKWMLDWLRPTVIGSGERTLALGPSGTSQDCVAIWPDLEAEDIFSELFIVQNRQAVENDDGLPGKGLMIWHINARLASTGDFAFNNSDTPNKLVRLMEADGLEDVEAKRGFNADDLYTQGKTFGPSTTPSSKRYNGSTTFVDVSNITASGSQMSATFKVLGLKHIFEKQAKDVASGYMFAHSRAELGLLGIGYVWLLVSGVLTLDPKNWPCINCGASIDIPGYIGNVPVIIMGIGAIVLGVLGLGIVFRNLRQAKE